MNNALRLRRWCACVCLRSKHAATICFQRALFVYVQHTHCTPMLCHAMLCHAMPCHAMPYAVRVCMRVCVDMAFDALVTLARSGLVAQLGPRHRLRFDVDLALLQLGAASRRDADVVEATFRVLDTLLWADEPSGAAGGE